MGEFKLTAQQYVSSHKTCYQTFTLFTGGAKAARRTYRIVKLINFFNSDFRYFLDYKLSNPVSTFDLNYILRICIESNHADLSTVPTVNKTWRIDDGKTLLCGEATTRLYKARKTRFYSNGNTRANNTALSRLQNDVFSRIEIEASIAWVCIFGCG